MSCEYASCIRLCIPQPLVGACRTSVLCFKAILGVIENAVQAIIIAGVRRWKHSLALPYPACIYLNIAVLPPEAWLGFDETKEFISREYDGRE